MVSPFSPPTRVKLPDGLLPQDRISRLEAVVDTLENMSGQADSQFDPMYGGFPVPPMIAPHYGTSVLAEEPRYQPASAPKREEVSGA